MKKFLIPIFFSFACVSSNANAWFFFFLPGSVSSKISDAVTGSEGENCVKETAKVGDLIKLPNGSVMAVKSLSGTSSRCTNSEFPIRALLKPSSAEPTQNTTQAKIDLPDGWESKPPNDAQKFGGAVMRAYNRTIDSWILISATKRSGITDISTLTKTRRVSQANRMQDPQISGITELAIGGLPAWRFELTGKFNAVTFSYMQTIFEGSEEIVTIEVWTTAANFPQVKEGLIKIVDSLTGVTPPVTSKSAEATVTPASPPAQPQHRDTGTQGGNSQPPTVDIAQKLRELSALFKDGLITKEEFDAKKKEILKSM